MFLLNNTFYILTIIMNYFSTAYSYPFNLQGVITRTITLLGCTELGTRRIHNMPSNNAIEFYKGDNKMLRVFVKDENLNIINLNGAEAKFFLAYTSKSSSYILYKTTTQFTQGIIRTPERGEVVFFIDSVDTQFLTPDQYFYQVIITLSNGERYTVVSGNLNLHANLMYTREEEQPIDPPIPPSPITEVDVPVGAYNLPVFIEERDIIIPTLVAPSGSSDQVWVTNLVYGSGVVTIYFSSSIPTEGWRIMYTKSYL